MNDQYSWQQPRTEYHVAPAPSAPPAPTPEQMDQRVSLISKIWSRAIGMVALCIPLTAVMSDHGSSVIGVVLPVAVIAGATISTSVIWLTGHASPAPPALPPRADPQQLKELEQRLFNLETMDRYERLSYAEQAARQQQPGAALSAPGAAPRPVQSGIR